MSEKSFPVILAGRRWLLPHLPFRIIKTIQPLLFQLYAETTAASGAPLKESHIETLGQVVWRAIAYVDPTMDFDSFQNLPFSVGDLLSALPAVAEAAGLGLHTATAEASPEMGKSTSTD